MHISVAITTKSYIKIFAISVTSVFLSLHFSLLNYTVNRLDFIVSWVAVDVNVILCRHGVAVLPPHVH